MTDYVTTDATRNADLKQLRETLMSQRVRAVDYVASAGALRSDLTDLVLSGTESEISEDGVTPTAGRYSLTRGAENGLASMLDIPTKYMGRMRSTLPTLYDDNVNGWLDNDPSRKFLLRLLRSEAGDGLSDGVVRAVLSNSYKPIDNLDVLLAALDGIRKAGVKVAIDGCDLTDNRMYVRVAAPEVMALAPTLLKGYRNPFGGGGAVRANGARDTAGLLGAFGPGSGPHAGYEAGEQPVVFGGFVLSNSETGNGAFSITPRLIVKICKNGLTIPVDAFRRTHLGAKLEEGVVKVSAETQQRNLALVRSQTSDVVSTFLDTSYVEKKIAELERDAGVEVKDSKGTLEQVAKVEMYSQSEADDILNFFIDGGQRTAGGVAAAVTAYAQTIEDGDRAAELEATAVHAMAFVAKAGR